MVEYPPVLTKRDFTRRYQKSEFGNRSPTWDTLDDFLADHNFVNGGKLANGTYHLRNKVAWGVTYYNLNLQQLVEQYRKLSDPTQWYISEMAPHDKNLIQGEVAYVGKLLQLTYSAVPNKPMRDALAEETRVSQGILAVMMLKHYMCPNSFEWLNILLSRYQGHVIEFSTFSVCWGTLPFYNSVFWEVRNY